MITLLTAAQLAMQSMMMGMLAFLARGAWRARHDAPMMSALSACAGVCMLMTGIITASVSWIVTVAALIPAAALMLTLVGRADVRSRQM